VRAIYLQNILGLGSQWLLAAAFLDLEDNLLYIYNVSVYSVLSLYCMVDISHMHGTLIVVPYGTVVLALSSSLRWWYTMCTALGSANKDMLVWSMTRYLG